MTNEEREQTAATIDYLVPCVKILMELTPPKECIERVDRIIGNMLGKIEMLIQKLD